MSRASIYKRIALVILMLLAINVDVYSIKTTKANATENHVPSRHQHVQTDYTQQYLVYQHRAETEMMQKEAEKPQAQQPPAPRLLVSVPPDVLYSIGHASQKYNIPEHLLLSQAYTESRFNANDTGSAGDIGLFQVLPSTAYYINRMGFNIQGFNPNMLYDPNLNAEFACWYLNYLHSQTHNWTATLTAYNMGIGGLEQHQRKYGSSDSAYFYSISSSHMKLFGQPLSI